MAFVVIWLFLNGWAVIQLLKRVKLYTGNERKVFWSLLLNGLGIPAALVFVYYALLYPSYESVASGGNTLAASIGVAVLPVLSGWLVYHFSRHQSPRSVNIIVAGSTVIASVFGYLVSVYVTFLLRSF